MRIVEALLLSLILAGCNDPPLTAAARGPEIEVEPSSVLFDAVSPGNSSTKTVLVSNRGGGRLLLQSLAVGGETPGVFHVDPSAAGSLPVELGPDESIAVQIVFAPDQPTGHAAVLTVGSTDPDRPAVDVPLAVGLLAADIDAQPNPLSFGQVTVNQSASQDVTVTNVGGADLHVDDAALSAGSSAAFQVDAGSLPATLGPGESLTLPVTFSPTNTAAATGTLEITSDDPDEPTTAVPLSGNGTAQAVPDVNASPSSINFGQVQRLTCANRTTSVQNTGTATLNVSNITRAIFTSTEYTVSPTSFTVAPGGAQTITVTYCPLDTGVDFGSLNVASNDPDENPYSIGLYGEGVPPPVNQTDIAVQITWDKNDTDIDTHFLRPGGSFNNIPGDCYYLNMSPDWGVQGDPTDDPYLDYDDVDGYGPENLNFAKVASGTYKLIVYYYSDHGQGSTKVTVKVWLNGSLAYTSSPKTLSHHQRWDLMNITWNSGTDSGTISMIDTVTQMFAFGPDSK